MGTVSRPEACELYPFRFSTRGVCHDENDVQSHVRIGSGRTVRQPGLRARARRASAGAAAALAMLLGNASVQKELKLDDEQIEKGQGICRKGQRRDRRENAGLSGSRGRKNAATKMQAITKEINEVGHEGRSVSSSSPSRSPGSSRSRITLAGNRRSAIPRSPRS